MSFRLMLYVHIPGRRPALMDTADSILKCLGFKNWLRAFRSIIGWTPPDFLGTTKIMLKNPGPVPGGTGSRAPFFRRASNCSWRVSIFLGSRDDMVTGARSKSGGGLSSSR